MPTSAYGALFLGSEAVTLAAGSTIGGVTPGGTSGNAPVNVTGSTLTLSPTTHAGRLVTLNRAAGIAITPPAATGTGNVYTLYVGTTVTSNTITLDAKAGNASDVFKGWLQTYKATTFTPYVADSTANLLTMDGSTTGGVAGDYIQIIDAALHVWVIQGFTTQSGSIATPFSAH